jgi:hypothetical protein
MLELVAHVMNEPTVDYGVLESCLQVFVDTISSSTDSSKCDTISVCVLDPFQGKSIFNMRRNVPMSTLMELFVGTCDKKKDLTFHFRGQPLKPTATVQEIGLSDMDYITAMCPVMMSSVRTIALSICYIALLLSDSYRRCLLMRKERKKVVSLRP